MVSDLVSGGKCLFMQFWIECDSRSRISRDLVLIATLRHSGTLRPFHFWERHGYDLHGYDPHGYDLLRKAWGDWITFSLLERSDLSCEHSRFLFQLHHLSNDPRKLDFWRFWKFWGWFSILMGFVSSYSPRPKGLAPVAFGCFFHAFICKMDKIRLWPKGFAWSCAVYVLYIFAYFCKKS